MTFDAEQMFQLATAVAETALGLKVDETPAAPTSPDQRSTAACIQITGAWNGAVLLECPVYMARLAASVMFSAEPAAMTTADLQDALAELVNMIGGNFKALLPETCYLSLPAVVEGGDYSTRVPGSASVGSICFSCQGHPMTITILEKVLRTAAA